MASGLYKKYKESVLGGSLSFSSNNVALCLVDAADYTVDLTTHQFLSSVAGAGRVATSGNFASKTITNGIADAADITLTSVSGDVSEAIIIFENSGSDATADLMVYIDTATGLPITPNGANIDIVWNASGIYEV